MAQRKLRRRRRKKRADSNQQNNITRSIKNLRSRNATPNNINFHIHLLESERKRGVGDFGFFFFGKTEKGGKVKVNDDKDGDLRSGLAIRF